MHMQAIPLILLGYVLTTATCDSSAMQRPDNSYDVDNSIGVAEPMDKRAERYSFGLGRRAYTYTAGGGAGIKRLPVYNFGLGKRAR